MKLICRHRTPDSNLSKSSRPYSPYLNSPQLEDQSDSWLLTDSSFSSDSSSVSSSDPDDRGTLKRGDALQEETKYAISWTL